jgi:hypothetical protein
MVSGPGHEDASPTGNVGGNLVPLPGCLSTSSGLVVGWPGKPRLANRGLSLQGQVREKPLSSKIQVGGMFSDLTQHVNVHSCSVAGVTCSTAVLAAEHPHPTFTSGSSLTLVATIQTFMPPDRSAKL